ncbi:MAG: HD domain-containing protein, partial [Deltaproteobacteria bacterium]|nr:HD domain-containing protein [Deltaproteobacteria bacterium]
MIAKTLKWNSPVNIYKISMGGLFHDVGKKEIDRDILNKPKRDRNPEETKIIESHPMRGMEILRKVKGIPNDILQIIFQHHENCTGQGYPVGLRKHAIHPMARLIAVANEFCSYAIKNPENPEGCSPEVAIKKMLENEPNQWDHNVLSALMEVFNYPIPLEFAKGRVRKKSDENTSKTAFKRKKAF